MEEDNTFGHRINGSTIREAVLDKADISLLMQGIGYAREKEFTTVRKKAYKELMAKLNVVIHGRARYSGKSI